MSVLNPPLNITEEDGSPKAWPYKAKFANGTVTDNGDGTVSITGGGGGGPETDPVFTAWNDPDVAYLTPGTAAATYEPLLPATPTNPETQFLNGNREWAPIRHNQLQAWNEDSDYQHIDAADRTNLDNLSGTNSGDQLTYKTIAVAGQSDVVATSGTDTLTLAAGNNITLTTDAVNRKVTITSAGGAGGVTTLNGLSGDISIAGTTNQINVAAAGSAVTLSTPQDIDTAATPRFARLGLGVAAGASNPLTMTGLTVSSLGVLTVNPSFTANNGIGIQISPTWNNINGTYKGLYINPTIVNAGSTSTVLETGATTAAGLQKLSMGVNGFLLHTFIATTTGGAPQPFKTKQTWNGATASYSAITADVTDNASGAGSMLQNLMVGGVTKFKIRKDGTPFAASYQLIDGTLTNNDDTVVGGNVTWQGAGMYTYFHGLRFNITAPVGYYDVTRSTFLNFILNGTQKVLMKTDCQLTVAGDTITRAGTLWSWSGGFNNTYQVFHGHVINVTDSQTTSYVGSTYFKVQQSSVDAFAVAKNSNVVIGSGALATTATNGFLNITTSPGAPTGVPTAYTGRVALHYDTTNDDLYIYNGGWKKTHLA